MPMLLMPALWVGGGVVFLGASYYALHALDVIPSAAELMTMATKAAQRSKVEKVMHEHKQGTLKSSSGRKVRSREQAIAIAMSESGQSRKRKKAS